MPLEAITSRAVSVGGLDQAAEARRCAVDLAHRLQFDETQRGRIAVIATECATNLVKHAGAGEILIQEQRRRQQTGMELLALDNGPGMADTALCFRDGYSTAGSPGTGLGAIARLSSECDVFSEVGKGTALLARVWRTANGGPEAADSTLEIGAVCVPKTGEEVCGDAWATSHGPGFASFVVVDGLGHGPAAADCAAAALEAYSEVTAEEPVQILRSIHAALRATRGAAVAVGRLEFDGRVIRFAGTGNISGMVHGNGGSKQLVSLPGIAGHNMTGIREFSYAWPRGSVLVLYSDGLASHWSLESYPGLAVRDTTLMAGVLYRDRRRGRDDATVVVIREKGER